MPRIRTIKPEFFQDEKMAAAPLIDRFVFLGLISMADDAGRILDNLKVIDAYLFPVSSDSAQESLRRLSGMGRVRRGRTASGQSVVEIVNWRRHQWVSHPNLKGAFPEIVETLEDRANSGAAPEPLRNESGGSPTPIAHGGAPASINDLRSTVTTKELRSGSSGATPEPLRKPKPSTNGPHPNWVVEAQTIYERHIGKLPHARLGNALKPLVDQFGWEVVRKWFTAYCDAEPYRMRDGHIHGTRPGDKPEGAIKDTRFCSPEKFVQTYAEWREYCAPMVSR